MFSRFRYVKILLNFEHSQKPQNSMSSDGYQNLKILKSKISEVPSAN